VEATPQQVRQTGHDFLRLQLDGANMRVERI
jgi:hypothetical protein